MQRLYKMDKKIEDFDEAYMMFSSALEDFMAEPTIANRKRINECSMILSKTRNSLIRFVNDFWCKGE